MVISEIFIEGRLDLVDPCPKCGKDVIKISYDLPDYKDVFTFQSYKPIRTIHTAGTYVLHHEPTIDDTRTVVCYMDDPQFSMEVRENNAAVTRIRFRYKGQWTTNRRMHTW